MGSTPAAGTMILITVLKAGLIVYAVLYGTEALAIVIEWLTGANDE